MTMLVVLLPPVPAQAQQVMPYLAAAADNPLKGLVPYARPQADRFPHSMEFSYLPLSDLMTGPDQFDWQPLETLLDDIASRGNQAVFRIWMEYPGHREGIPTCLEDDGLKVTQWLNENTQPFPSKQVRTPDYSDPALRAALRSFVAALGEKYDGDPRIGFITAGLLGTWGEWHTYPRVELMADETVQAEVMTAYEQAFTTTPVLLRYPAGEDAWAKAANDRRKLGYHDDSFAWATLDTGRQQDDWFSGSLESGGTGGDQQVADAADRWRNPPGSLGADLRRASRSPGRHCCRSQRQLPQAMVTPWPSGSSIRCPVASRYGSPMSTSPTRPPVGGCSRHPSERSDRRKRYKPPGIARIFEFTNHRRFRVTHHRARFPLCGRSVSGNEIGLPRNVGMRTNQGAERMDKTASDSNRSEQFLDELVASCNDIQTTLHQSATAPVHHDQSGPLRWRESCDKMIAIAGDMLQFRVILEHSQLADETDIVRAILTRRFPRNLTFDQLNSVFIDGLPATPTNDSINRSLSLDFHQIRSGAIVVVTYQVRVNFNAQTTKVIVGDTNVAWDWVSRSERSSHDTSHTAAKRIPAPHQAVPAAKEFAWTMRSNTKTPVSSIRSTDLAKVETHTVTTPAEWATTLITSGSC